MHYKEYIFERISQHVYFLGGDGFVLKFVMFRVQQSFILWAPSRSLSEQ